MSATPTIWYTPEELVPRLRMDLSKIRGLCRSGQMAWRPQNPDSRTPRYLISEEAVQAYERAITRPVTVRPLRRNYAA